MTRTRLAPSMMVVNSLRLPEALSAFTSFGVDLFHIDVMDGRFVPNLMLGTNYVHDLREASDIPLDLHMMVDEPVDKVEWFGIQPGEWVSVHAETTTHLQRTLAVIKGAGAKARVALNPSTPLSALEWVLDDIDGILLMTVNPGFAGQQLVPQTIRKIKELRHELDGRGLSEMDIEVDGNVSIPHARQMVDAGANTLVLGTSVLFKAEGALEAELEGVRKAVDR